MPGTVPIFIMWEARNHGFGVRMGQVVADGLERHDGWLSTRAWLQDSDLHVVQRADGGAGVETVYSVLNDGRSLQIRRQVWEPSGDNESCPCWQQFAKCEKDGLDSMLVEKGGSIRNAFLDGATLSKPDRILAEPKTVEAVGPYTKVPTPPLMPCAPSGAPSRQPIARRRFQRPAVAAASP
ncbi:Copb2 [Symbiodinium pilosum]|uniref:Copb2 protein n=1 Tax=Symbiodinium pilosum TaxID=2952 RepID=A0A812XCQ9_SYMPI|nr:Copb2 [Symbiodinium pilosum]